MGKYGDIAVEATRAVQAGSARSPVDAWQAAAERTFSGQIASQKKGCPKGAYLGLCEEGWVVGVPRGRYSAGVDNKAYAVAGVQLLIHEPELVEAGAAELWRRVMGGRRKTPNSQ